jgi:hypothetical protein
VVSLSAQRQAPGFQAAFGKLCRIYREKIFEDRWALILLEL